MSTEMKTSLDERYAALPREGYVRLSQFLGDRKRGVPPLLPISRSSWYAGIAAGRWSPGVRLGPRTRAWSAAYIRSVLEAFETDSPIPK